MNLGITHLNKAIHELCNELQETMNQPTNWKALSEEDLFYEVVACIFGSQMPFETAEAAAKSIRAKGFLLEALKGNANEVFCEKLKRALKTPVNVEISGVKYSRLPRFNNRLAHLVCATAKNLSNNATSIRKLLLRCSTSREAREALVENVHGFGPKQASLFLRRIGFCSDLAVLDVHILDYLALKNGSLLKRSSLGRLDFYEMIESEFIQIAREFGFSVGAVDLAMWVTMRVAKKEYRWAL